MEEQSFGTDDWVESIIELYSGTVYRLAYARTGNRADADDIFQEVFLRFIRKRPEFQNREHGKAWFIRVTLNCTNSFWKSPFCSKHEALTEEIIAEEIPKTDLEWELAQLPQQYRTVIHLFYYEEMTCSQIAELLKKKESTIRMQLTRARRMLKDFMEGEKDDI